MRRVMRAVIVGLAIVACPLGCNQAGTPQVETFEVPDVDPVAEAKAILTNYAKGMPVTSEASAFPDLVAKVKAKDAAKGELLEKGLNEITANPGSAKAKSIELLKKL